MTSSSKFLDTIKSCLTSRRFWKTFVLGQALALCITSTNHTTGKLAEKKHDVSTFQSFCTYALLTLIYLSITIYKAGLGGLYNILKKHSLYYFALGLADVEANYFIVKGFSNTSLLSAKLINGCSTPGVVLLSFMLLKTQYQWNHLCGVVLSLLGLILLISSDVLAGKDNSDYSNATGDAYCILAAILYSISNVLEEFLVRKRPKWEILAMLGVFGTLISGIQMVIVDREQLAAIRWEADDVWNYSGYTIAMFILYTLVPVVMDLSSATFTNISMLTNDFYTLIINIILISEKFHPLYPFGYIMVIIGLVMYNLCVTSSQYNHDTDRVSIDSKPPIYPNEDDLAEESSKDGQTRDFLSLQMNQ